MRIAPVQGQMIGKVCIFKKRLHKISITFNSINYNVNKLFV